MPNEDNAKYCDLLLAKGAWHAVRDRMIAMSALSVESRPLYALALDKLAMGRAFLGLSASRDRDLDSSRSNGDAARSDIHQAIDGLRAAGTSQILPVGLFARAAFRRSVGNWDGAARDLDEVEEIAELGPMRLHLCDMALERARLALARIEAFAPLNGLLEDNPPKPVTPDATEAARL